MTAGFFTFLYFHLITSKFIYFQRIPRSQTRLSSHRGEPGKEATGRKFVTVTDSTFPSEMDKASIVSFRVHINILGMRPTKLLLQKTVSCHLKWEFRNEKAVFTDPNNSCFGQLRGSYKREIKESIFFLQDG